jgi:hypothetical protein
LGKGIEMSANNLKQELISYIESIEDEELLSLLKEDILFYKRKDNADIIDDLSEEQLQELKTLIEEDDLKDTQTLEDFKKATDKWRIK